MAFSNKGKGARRSPFGSPNAVFDISMAKGGKKGKASGGKSGKSGKQSKKGDDSCYICGEQGHSNRQCPNGCLPGDVYLKKNMFCTEPWVKLYSEDSPYASHLKEPEVEPPILAPPIRSASSSSPTGTMGQSLGGLISKASSKAGSIRSPTSSLEPPSCPETPASGLLTKVTSKAMGMISPPPSPPISDADLTSPNKSLPGGPLAPKAEPLKRAPSPSFNFALPPPSKKVRCEDDEQEDLPSLLSELPSTEKNALESCFDLPPPVKVSDADEDAAAAMLPKVGFLLPPTEAETLSREPERNAMMLGGDEEEFKKSTEVSLASLLPPLRATGGLFASIPPPSKRTLGDSEEEEVERTKKRLKVDAPDAEESQEEDKARVADEDMMEDVAVNSASLEDENQKILVDEAKQEPASCAADEKPAEDEKETAVESTAQNVPADEERELERKVEAREKELQEEELWTSLTAKVAQAMEEQAPESSPSPSDDVTDAEKKSLSDDTEAKTPLVDDKLEAEIADKKEQDIHSEPPAETKMPIASDDTPTHASMVAEVSLDEINRELDDLLDKAQEGRDTPADDIVKMPATVAKAHPLTPLPHKRLDAPTFVRSELAWSAGSTSSKDPGEVNHKNRAEEDFIDPFLQIAEEREKDEAEEKAATAAKAAATAEASTATVPTSFSEKDPYLSPDPSEADEEVDELELDEDMTQQTEECLEQIPAVSPPVVSGSYGLRIIRTVEVGIKKAKEVPREVVKEVNGEEDADELELDNDDDEEALADVAEDATAPELELAEDAYGEEVADDMELDDETELEMEEDIDDLELDGEVESAKDGEDEIELDM
eukprot:GEMP01010239.1.p1 GENE.GEMP01010239.1~~GEMP01010239.1.p1  ORF type:complete len:832 (+),score=251.62 GEMP01010239.1:39-2534(+)